MPTIGRFLDRVYYLGAWMAGALLILLCLLVLYSIVARLVGWFAGGASDVAGYVMATSTFMALAYTFRSHGHIRVSILTQRLMGGHRRLAEIWAHLVIAALSSFMAFYMIRLVYDSYDFGDRSEGADAILLWIPQAPMAAGTILFAISTVHVLLLTIFDYASVDPELNEGGGPQEV